MSGVNTDQLHRSTLGVYDSLVNQFNPGLQRLVALGRTYAKAFDALAISSEEYFYALSQMGEQARRTLSSRSIGDVIIQIAESQKRLTKELDGMFRWFHAEVVQDLDNNVRRDKDFISGSRQRYEMEVRNRHSMEMQRRRGYQSQDDYIYFLRESQREALKEEERRYRFLAEKHCNLSLHIAQLMNKTGGALQQRAEDWSNRLNQTREPQAPSRTEQGLSMGMREEERNQRWPGKGEMALGKVPSRGPSPQPTRSRSGSMGDGLSGGRPMRAVASHPATNPTMLEFYKGDTIILLKLEPRNGWLYGKSENGTSQGWFPAQYVEPLEQTSRPPSSSLRSSSSMSNLLDQSGGGRQSAPPPPAPPLPSGGIPPPSTPATERRTEKKQKQKSNASGGIPVLFPKGTNPFATVKLKPTVTNDRSAPRV